MWKGKFQREKVKYIYIYIVNKLRYDDIIDIGVVVLYCGVEQMHVILLWFFLFGIVHVSESALRISFPFITSL